MIISQKQHVYVHAVIYQIVFSINALKADFSKVLKRSITNITIFFLFITLLVVNLSSTCKKNLKDGPA